MPNVLRSFVPRRKAQIFVEKYLADKESGPGKAAKWLFEHSSVAERKEIFGLLKREFDLKGYNYTPPKKVS